MRQRNSIKRHLGDGDEANYANNRMTDRRLTQATVPEKKKAYIERRLINYSRDRIPRVS